MLNTIGYEGATPTDFIATLNAANVRFVFDIRDRAQSRRPGFSKTALEITLFQAGIGYLHLKELGDPKDGRDAARSGDMLKFRRIFSSVLAKPEAQAAILQIIETAEVLDVCLLCYERSANDCHRKLVSDKIELETGMKARHLGVHSFEQIEKYSRRMPGAREGTSTPQ
jgi:uncharacterized protein (DUF488 family)